MRQGNGNIRFRGHYLARAHRTVLRNGVRVLGEELWNDEIHNLVPNQGLNYALNAALLGNTISTWYLALLKTAPVPLSTSTYLNYMGSANQEVVAYASGSRPAWVAAAPSLQSISNSASPGSFSINADGTVVGGVALVSFATKGNTAQAGAILLSAGAFSGGDKTLGASDALIVTLTLTAGDDGV